MTAFSNGTEFDVWSANWCQRCIKDAPDGDPEGPGGCAILSDVFLTNEVPEQWKPGTDDYRDRYRCTKFEGKHD